MLRHTIKNNRIKVLQLISTLWIGGAEKVVSDIALNLDPHRYDVRVCCIKKKGVLAEDLERKDIPVYLLSHSGKKRSYISGFRLLNLIRSEKISILHSHGTAAFFDGAFAALFGRVPLYIHTFHFGNYPHYPSKYIFGERFASKVPHHLVSVSNHQREKLIQLQRIPAGRISTIYNGVVENHGIGNKELIEGKKKELNIAGNNIILGSAAVLSNQKGITYLLDAAKIVINSFKNVKFVIVGDGKLKTELEEKTKSLGLSNYVTFTGWRTDVPEVLLTFDVFLMSSLWEGLPVALLEAMAAGKSVVATSVGDNPLIVNNGITGYIVPPKKPEEMAESILKIINNPNKMRQMGEAALRQYKTKFTMHKMIQNYSNLYEEFLSKNNRH